PPPLPPPTAASPPPSSSSSHARTHCIFLCRQHGAAPSQLPLSFLCCSRAPR
ncbi:hypothetical protein KUCAC02_011211, partial [Chaenocephalus aceratus]